MLSFGKLCFLLFFVFAVLFILIIIRKILFLIHQEYMEHIYSDKLTIELKIKDFYAC